MANIKSQIKRNRQALKQRLRNKSVRSRLKTELKSFATAAEGGDRSAAEAAFQRAVRSLDKAATKGVVHQNFAANHKSKMAKRLASL